MHKSLTYYFVRRPEPRTRLGEVLLSRNHICLLNGLLDRPGGRAESTADWVRAGMRVLAMHSGYARPCQLIHAVPSIHSSWAALARVRGRNQWTLTDRGRGIVDRTIPARIRGVGPYLGFTRPAEADPRPASGIPGVELPTPQIVIVDQWWRSALADPGHREIVSEIGAILGAWSRRQDPDGQDAELTHRARQEQLRRFMCHHVLPYDALPSGRQRIAPVSPGQRLAFTVDFDELATA